MRSWWRRLVDHIAPMHPGDQSHLDMLDRPNRKQGEP